MLFASSAREAGASPPGWPMLVPPRGESNTPRRRSWANLLRHTSFISPLASSEAPTRLALPRYSVASDAQRTGSTPRVAGSLVPRLARNLTQYRSKLTHYRGPRTEASLRQEIGDGNARGRRGERRDRRVGAERLRRHVAP